MSDDWDGRLAALYRELDGVLAEKGWACRGCGECCHFDVAPHVLYASEMEKCFLLGHSEMPGRSDGDAGMIARGERCPYQVDNRCLAREGRPLGCRLHFCDAPESEDTEFFEEWHVRLKTLHADVGYAWRYGPLLPL